MDQINVPQFLDVEDKIIGAVTVRQFLELLVAALILFIFYRIFDFSLFVLSGLFVITVTIAVAFIKINGQTFHYFLLNFFVTMKNPKLKVWRKSVSLKDFHKDRKDKKNKDKTVVIPARRPLVTSSHLSELSLIVDTGGVYQGEKND